MGPVNPVCPPTNAGSSGCCVWLAWAVGAGVRNVNGFGLRAITSKRGIAVEKGCTPNSGLGGAPVGMLLPGPLAAWALVTKGLRPWIGARAPPAVIRPHLTNSRRVTFPCEKALTISARLLRAFPASLIRALEDFSDKKNPSFLSMVINGAPQAAILQKVSAQFKTSLTQRLRSQPPAAS